MNLLQKIQCILDWTPNELLRIENGSKYIKYDTPRVEGDLFWGVTTSNGLSITKYLYSGLDRWLADIPSGFAFILLTVGTIIIWAIYLPCKIVFEILKSFMPQKWFLKDRELSSIKKKFFIEKLKGREIT